MKRQSGKINLFFLMMVCAAFVFAIASTAMASVADQMTGGKTPAASAPGGNALVSVAPGVNIDAKLRSDLEKKLAAINAKYDVHVGVVFMDRVSGGSTAEQLAKAGVTPRLMVDFSHANSRKDYSRQMEVARDVAAQLQNGEQNIMGIMVESHLVEGRQDKPETYGQSITDACIGWDATEELLALMAEANRGRV